MVAAVPEVVDGFEARAGNVEEPGAAVLVWSW
jgi:hypothetical protein